jgi:hypothetical protein
MPKRTPQPKRTPYSHVAQARLDDGVYSWLESIHEEYGVPMATALRLAAQWAHWIDVDFEARFPGKAPEHGFAAYVRSELKSGE